MWIKGCDCFYLCGLDWCYLEVVVLLLVLSLCDMLIEVMFNFGFVLCLFLFYFELVMKIFDYFYVLL